MTDLREIPLRLAFRSEGPFWNAYLATRDSMEGAKLIGSILLRPSMENDAIKDGFMDLMKAVFNHAVEQTTGHTIDYFDVQPAPEHERSGHG